MTALRRTTHLSIAVKRLILVCLFAAYVLVGAGCNVPHTTNQPQAGGQQTPNQPQPSPRVSPATTHDSYDFSSIDDLLARIAQKHGGCALVVVKDEKVIYRKGFGSHDPDSVIPVAS